MILSDCHRATMYSFSGIFWYSWESSEIHQTEKERNGFQETGDPQGSYEGSTPEDTCAANLLAVGPDWR